ncbi:DUF427 domain-containing protein [Amycolatopsis aidingensis]|uniref:DUF427 domain-containing protein n=1 Tax=Amycolatopsis aidingensis TaxID=2842453 RepID=UPI001C0B65A1|nr:DUF427 domain-containing protein [Amycolatopsis aidingensis]
MLRAVWNGVVLAETPRTVRLEGRHYFPPESLNREFFAESGTRTLCPWKGVASYYTLVCPEAASPNAAWRYRHPTPLAYRIKNHVAFNAEVTIHGGREPARSWVRRLLDRLRGARV